MLEQCNDADVKYLAAAVAGLLATGTGIGILALFGLAGGWGVIGPIVAGVLAAAAIFVFQGDGE